VDFPTRAVGYYWYGKEHYSKARFGIFTTLEEETETAQAYTWSGFKKLSEADLFPAFWCLV